jgi:TraX protein
MENVGKIGQAVSGSHTRYILTGASLDTIKVIAMVLMVFDHVNEVCFEGAYAWMYYLGRGAFPLFAFAMACHLLEHVPLSKYVERLTIFALISQPVFALAFYEDAGNILFTLALGSIVGVWTVNRPAWRRHMLGALALLSLSLYNFVDFALVGIMLPALLACAMGGDRISWFWTAVLLVLLNVNISDVAVFDEGFVFSAPDLAIYLTIASTMLLPVLSYVAVKSIHGARFLPRHALYIFYPAHLFLLAVYNLTYGASLFEFLDY